MSTEFRKKRGFFARYYQRLTDPFDTDDSALHAGRQEQLVAPFNAEDADMRMSIAADAFIPTPDKPAPEPSNREGAMVAKILFHALM